jgi:hypothetical protein
MKNILLNLAAAKTWVKKAGVKHSGYNKYSEYSYYTPSQIEDLVGKACEIFGLLTVFSLVRSELGIVGVLDIYHTESGETLQLEMAIDVPEIKATNKAQQYGGAMTYAERYLKMTAFGIVENSSDFDAKTTRPPQQKQQLPPSDDKKWFNIANKDGEQTIGYKQLLARIAGGKEVSLKKMKEAYKISKIVEEQLLKDGVKP